MKPINQARKIESTQHSRIDSDDLALFNSVIKHFQKKYNLSANEMIQLISHEEESHIPLCIFDNNKLSVFEALTKYLAENRKLNLKKIAKLLNKTYNTIWTTYSNAKKKHAQPLPVSPSKLIPISIFSNTKLTIFESLVKYLKEQEEMSNKEIALLLHRNNKTIWTIYNNAKKK